MNRRMVRDSGFIVPHLNTARERRNSTRANLRTEVRRVNALRQFQMISIVIFRENRYKDAV